MPDGSHSGGRWRQVELQICIAVESRISIRGRGVGIYGVVSYATRQRTHELGIRIALGAGKGAILRNVLRQGMILTLTGLSIGIVAPLFLTRFLRTVLIGVAARDALTYATVSIVLCSVAMLACYMPARRASAIDPAQALRSE